MKFTIFDPDNRRNEDVFTTVDAKSSRDALAKYHRQRRLEEYVSAPEGLPWAKWASPHSPEYGSCITVFEGHVRPVLRRDYTPRWEFTGSSS